MIPCVQRVIRWTLCPANKADDSRRVVAPHAVFHIEGHILLTKYHWLSQYHVRARGRVLAESTKSSRLLAGGVRRHMLYHLPAVPLPQHLQDENIYSLFTRLWGLWLTLLVVGISEGKLNRHHKGTFFGFFRTFISCLGKPSLSK